jgi:carbamate kinase
MSERRLAVIAVGGDALVADPARSAVTDQFRAVSRSMRGVFDLISDGWTVVIIHGNGPQVGFALRRSELSAAEVPPLPMDYADADAQGVIGYMCQRALGNELRRRGVRRGRLLPQAHHPRRLQPRQRVRGAEPGERRRLGARPTLELD